MKLNNEGIELIKSFEKCVLTVYRDAVGFNTVGWGHRTILPVGDKIDQKKADSLLAEDLEIACNGVKSCVKVLLNDNQFSALVSFAFNLGVSRLKGSTLLRLLNSGKTDESSKEFPKWCKAGGVTLRGLLYRRVAEQELFKKPVRA